LGAAFLYDAATSHAAHRFVERDSGRGLSMRIVLGIALALLLSPASGETLVERGAYARMTALDLDAMVAFLRTLPPRN
jgi:hypothetical protein